MSDTFKDPELVIRRLREAQRELKDFSAVWDLRHREAVAAGYRAADCHRCDNCGSRNLHPSVKFCSNCGG